MKTKLIAVIVLSIILTFIAGLLMKILGKYEYPTITITLLVLWMVIGSIGFSVWYFFIRTKPVEKKEYELTKEEAKILARQKLMLEDGIIVGEEEIDTVRAVGDEKNKQPFLLWVVRDRLNRNIRIAYFRNLKNIQIESKIIDRNNEDSFIDHVIREMNATATPYQEPNKYVKIRYDPITKEEVFREEGINPTTVIQQEEKKDTVEVKEG